MTLREEILALFQDKGMRDLYDEVHCFETHEGEFDGACRLDDLDGLVPIVALAPADILVKQRLMRSLIDSCFDTSLEEYERLRRRTAYWWDDFANSALGRVYHAMRCLDYAVDNMGPSDKYCFSCCEVGYEPTGGDCSNYQIVCHGAECETLAEALEHVEQLKPQDETHAPYSWFRIEKRESEKRLPWRDTKITYFATSDGRVVGFDIPTDVYSRPTCCYDYAYAWWRSIDPEANCIVPYNPGDIVEVDHAPFGPKQLCRLTLDDDEYWLGEARKQFGDEWVDRGLPDPNSDLSEITVSAKHSCQRQATSIWLYTSPREPFVADVESTPEIMRLPFAINAIFLMRRVGP